MLLRLKRFMQLTEPNNKLCKVIGAKEYYRDEQMQILAKIGDGVYGCGEKPGNNYPYLESGNKFWNRVRVPGSGYKSLMGTPTW